MLIDQISVFVENKPGRLSEITGVLADSAVDMRALSLADTSKYGILRLIVDNPKKAEEAFKQAGITVSKNQVIAVSLADEPGSMHKTLEYLQKEDISVEYSYAFIKHKGDRAYVILSVEDNDRALDALKRNGVELLTPSEVYSL